jgi:hypothetical protein
MEALKYTILFWVVFSVIIGIGALVSAETITPEEKERDLAELRYGSINPNMICPHCLTKASVRTNIGTKKVGISGGKAAAGLLTGGVSVLATGLSRKERVTKAHCDVCKVDWHV